MGRSITEPLEKPSGPDERARRFRLRVRVYGLLAIGIFVLCAGVVAVPGGT